MSIETSKNYMRFAGMALQMAILITAFAFFGRWLDGQLQTGKGLTAAFALLGVGLAMYYFIRQSSAK
jgi:hypothetical protein